MAKKVEELTLEDVREARIKAMQAFAERIPHKPLEEQIKEMQELMANPMKWHRDLIKERLVRVLEKYVPSAPIRKKILYEMFGE